jgi:UDP-N-acetyl-D-mannosaminuronic acid dehydrogenase
MTNVLVIGLGEIGLPTARYYRDNGYTVWGWDIDYIPRTVAKEVSDIIVYDDFDEYALGVLDAICICVSTKAVFSVVEDLVKRGLLELTKRPLLIIESTVVPGTCRNIWDDVLNKRLGIAHVPQRFWGEDPHGRGVRRKRVVAASDDDTFVRAIKFLKDVNMPTYPVYGLEVAELCKVAENAYRNVMISYAEELYGVCDELGIDFWAVKEAIETHQTIGYLLEPRGGVGGHCLPMAADIMEEISTFNDIISAAKVADVKYRKLISE